MMRYMTKSDLVSTSQAKVHVTNGGRGGMVVSASHRSCDGSQIASPIRFAVSPSTWVFSYSDGLI